MSAIHIPSFAPSMLVSGGGDSVLKVWDWMSGKLLLEIPILDVFGPHIKVKAPLGKREREDGDNEDGEGIQRNIGRRRKGRKGKGKAQNQDQLGDGEDGGDGTSASEIPQDQKESILHPEDANMMAVEQPAAEARSRTVASVDSEDVTSATRGERTVLVLHKIQSVDLTATNQGCHLIFSAVG